MMTLFFSLSFFLSLSYTSFLSFSISNFSFKKSLGSPPSLPVCVCHTFAVIHTPTVCCEVEVGGGSRTSFLARHTVGRSADRVVKSNSSGSNVSRKGQLLLLLLLLFFSCLDKLPKWISKSSDPKPFGAHGVSTIYPQQRQQHFKINNLTLGRFFFDQQKNF
jgi:hypothetical protein